MFMAFHSVDRRRPLLAATFLFLLLLGVGLGLSFG
jgi:hypothetical protein